MIDGIDRTFAALSEPTRRQVVELLRGAPRRAGDLAEEVGMSRPALSRHLRILRTSGLVDVELDAADARGRVYRLRPERFTAMQAWLDQVQAFWSDQLAQFKAHAERQQASG